MEPVLSMQHVRMAMLKHGGEVNLPGNDGKSPLFVACLNGFEEIVQLLLDNGASSNVTTDGGVSLFDIACENILSFQICYGKMLPKVNSNVHGEEH